MFGHLGSQRNCFTSGTVCCLVLAWTWSFRQAVLTDASPLSFPHILRSQSYKTNPLEYATLFSLFSYLDRICPRAAKDNHWEDQEEW